MMSWYYKKWVKTWDCEKDFLKESLGLYKKLTDPYFRLLNNLGYYFLKKILKTTRKHEKLVLNGGTGEIFVLATNGAILLFIWGVERWAAKYLCRFISNCDSRE